MRARKILFSLLYIAFLLAILEVASYLVVVHLYDNKLGNKSERHLYSSIRGHQLNPDYSRSFDTGNARIHSSQGFRRDGTVSVAKPDDTFRIIVLGGSTLYGIGVQPGDFYPAHPTLSNTETVPYYLETELKEYFAGLSPSRKVEVINAGVTAYHTFQHVLYFYETLYEYEPDMVLFLDGHNDFYNVGVTNPIKQYGYSSVNMVDALNRRKPFFSLHVFVNVFAEKSYFFKLVAKSTKVLFEKYEVTPYNTAGDYTALDRDFVSEFKETAHTGFMRNYMLIDSFANYYDFCFHVFLQPEVVFEELSLLSDHDANIADITRTHYGQPREELMKRSREQFSDLFSRNGIDFTDIGEIGGTEHKDEALYIDYTHLTPRGSKLVADRMLPVIKRMVPQCGQSR